MPVLLDDQDGLTDQLDEKQGRALYDAHNGWGADVARAEPTPL
jgi:hypothetical protein